MPSDDSQLNSHDPYAASRVPAFRSYWTGNFLAIIGMQMQQVTVSWEVYERTHSALALAYVGLVQVVPVVLLALLAGHVADRFDRRWVVIISLSACGLTSLALAAVSWWEAPVWLMYVCLFWNGVARAFLQPGKSSLLPLLVPPERFTNAITWSTSGFQLSSVVGPAVGGGLIAWFLEPALVYSLAAAMSLSFGGLLLTVRYQSAASGRQPLTLKSLLAGVEFVWSRKVVLGACTLDMFAVLLGGAVALLPIYAKDILKVGPTGLGWLQAAPAVGALGMSFFQSHRPPPTRAGRDLFVAVATFGVATIVFGVSVWFPLSFAMLLITGAADNVSVVIRHSLVQLLTPNVMRGRVSAINGMFIAVSNQVGEFESGLVAHLISPIFSVVSGGVGTLFVVAAAAWLWPELRRHGRLDGQPIQPEAEEEVDEVADSAPRHASS